MSQRFCDGCGAPITDKDVFCERCGALVNEDAEPRTVTQRMPRPDRAPRRPHPEIQPPIPIMDAPEEQRRRHRPQGGQAGQGGRPREDAPGKGRGDGTSGTVGWALFGVLAVTLAILIGYMMGTASTGRQPAIPKTTDDPRQEQRGDAGTGDGATGNEGGRQSAEPEVDLSPAEPADGNEPSDRGTAPADGTGEDDGKGGDGDGQATKDDEGAEARRLRESVSTEMALRPDGQLRLGVTVPTDNLGLSERIEVEQGGELVYSSRILSPGESLDWVPADGANPGGARVNVYGILGDRDYGKPVTVEVEIVAE